ncbi:MAG: zinc ABC transporter solute-binding protein [Opitutales bacterium]|nr:zinc ABC transporter solute-binding protein [Opitutales bacterium]
MNDLRLTTPLFAIFLLFGCPAIAAGPTVVVSINPIHSLVSGVMEGIGTANLLIKPNQTPHNYALRPSDVRSLNEATVIFWIGEELESFLVKPLETLDGNGRIVDLIDVNDVQLLKTREGGAWESHDEEDHSEHHHSNFDPHLWLDPQNARTIVQIIASVLSESDPANKDHYQKNAASIDRKLLRLTEEVQSTLGPVQNVPYIVFHDAFQYFEHRFKTNAVGSFTVDPSRLPGARRLYEVRRRIVDTRTRCVFKEPQVNSKLVASVTEGTSARIATLDPLGAALVPGPNAYFQLIRNIADTIRDCGASAQ